MIGELADAGRRRFTADVAGFGRMSHGGRFTGTSGDGDVIALAGRRAGRSVGYRGEFLQLVNLAASL